jgi:hypothetical protein
VAERVPERIDRLVYLTAFLLQSGESLNDMVERYPGVGPGSAIYPAEDPSRLMVDREQAIPIFYNCTPEAEARAAVNRLVPEPAAGLSKPLTLSGERFGRVPRAYIEVTQDRAIIPQMQRDMQAALPCAPVITLEADHSPFYSAVPELAEALLGFARKT